MRHASLFIECRHRFGPKPLSACCVDRAERHAGIDLTQHLFDHGAALVHLSHHAIGLSRVIERHNLLGPSRRARATHGPILQHVSATVLPQPGTDDAASICALAVTCRRINRHHHPDPFRHLAAPGLLDQLPLEQGVRIVLDQFAVQFLTAEPRAAITRHDVVQEPFRQMGAVVGRARMRDGRSCISKQSLDQRCRPRRRGDHHPRRLAEAQRKSQHVICGIRIFPFRHLVAPGCVELRPAEALWFICREHLRDRAVRPCEQPLRRLIDGPLVVHVNAEQTGLALDHDQPGLVEGRCQDGDPLATWPQLGPKSQGHRAHPFGPGASLSRTAPAEDQPIAPAPGIWWQLFACAGP